MKKNEFLGLLERRLHILNEKERKDILDEYRTHIEMKIRDGKSEEEAIQDFGDVEELIDEILDAYKINVEEMKQTEDSMDTKIDSMLETCKNIVYSLFSMDLGKLLSLLFEIFIIFVLLLLLKIPFSLISTIGSGLLSGILGYEIGMLLIKPWQVMVNVIYILVFLSTLIKALKKRIEECQGENVKNLKFFNSDFHKLDKINWKELIQTKRIFFLSMIVLLSFVFYCLFYTINWEAIYYTSILLCLMMFSGMMLIFMLFVYVCYKLLWKRKV